jgi:hypothetical protein
MFLAFDIGKVYAFDQKKFDATNPFLINDRNKKRSFIKLKMTVSLQVFLRLINYLSFEKVSLF